MRRRPSGNQRRSPGVRLTARGICLLAAGAVLYGAGEGLGFALLRALAGGAVGAVLLALVTTRRPRVEATREVPVEPVERGTALSARLTLHNRHRRAAPPGTGYEKVSGQRPVPVEVPALAPGATARRHYPLPTARRGRLVIGPLRLRYTDPLGLVVARATTGAPAVLWVRPRLHPARVAAVTRDNRFGTLPVDTPMRGSVDFQSLREYVAGDEPRHLHWKTVAHTGRLMTREFTDPQRVRVTIVLDNRRGVLPAAAFEEAVEVAASLTAAAIEGEHLVRLRTTAAVGRVGEVADTTASRQAPHAVIEQLCLVSQVARRAGFSAAEIVDRRSHGSSLVFITGAAALDELPPLAALRHRLGLLVAVDLAPGAPVEPAGFPLIRAGTAGEAVAMWNELVP